MSGGDRSRRVGIALAGVLLVGGAVLLLDLHLEQTHEHVVVEVLEADNTVRIDVDCHRAKAVGAGPGVRKVDLGYLPAGEPITISDFNDRGGAAWGYRIVADGETVVDVPPGTAASTAPLAEEFRVATVETYSPSGYEWGEVGCSAPLLVSAAIPDYQQLPAVRPPASGPRDLTRWSASFFPFEPLDTAAGLVLPLLMLIGFVATACIRPVRELLWNPRNASVATVIYIVFVKAIELFLGVGFDGLLVYAEALGVGLLVLCTIVSLWPHTGSQCQDSSSTPSPNQG